MQRSVLITLDGPSLEALIFDAVDKAIKINNTSYQHPSDSPNGDFNWLKSVFPSTPENTLRQWDAAGKIPGSSKFGKRRIYHKQTVLDWQRSRQISTNNKNEFSALADDQFNARHERRGKGQVA